ncbi:restriction endonuclease [Ralstonia pseudosolanacearum]|uniref:restriction endonuclease n=1 Tax=Ralstonia pseudosolanacearum TaxID=1310165 RepID=UPI003AACFF09
MTARWQEYQEEVADLFRSLGCAVEVEKEMEGARGLHVVDVVAKISVGGIAVTWIVECKLWNAAIPKEKVLVLSQVASDVGADRAFLLSESGFQSGAIRAPQNSNITLTSLSELFESVRQEIQHRELAALARKAHLLQRQLYDLMILDDGSRGPTRGAIWRPSSSCL